jgi:hypothetical protein
VGYESRNGEPGRRHNAPQPSRAEVREAREKRRHVHAVVTDGYLRELSTRIARPHAGRNSKRTEAQAWVRDPNNIPRKDGR